jgi:SAM-dependent methyltransferase
MLTGEIEAAAAHYRAQGFSHWAFARGKLRGDPLYAHLVSLPALWSGERIVDLGCGRGILLALMRERSHRDGRRLPPYLGLEKNEKILHVAERSVGAWGEFRPVDLERLELPPAGVVVLADVLHYLDGGVQERVLQQAASALRPGGVLLVRDADAGGGWRFLLTRAGERFCTVLRGQPTRRFCYRSRGEWTQLLESLGLEVASEPLSHGTPFGNVLFIARR